MQHVIDALAEECRRDLKRFIKLFWSSVENNTFVDGWHIDAIVEHLNALPQIQNLIICLPPRHAKSLLLVLWFGQLWARDPSLRFLFATYDSELSIRDSLKCRKLIESPLYQQLYGRRFQLADDQNTKYRFNNTAGGFRIATSVDSLATGEGGSVTICDDPHNIKKVDSKASRDAVINWYNNVFFSRVNSPATAMRIVMMQRSHPEDLVGALIRNDKANNWTKLVLPLEFRKSKATVTNIGWQDPRKEEGDILCPPIMPPKVVEAYKSQMTKAAWEAQFNQNPEEEGSGTFKRENLRYYSFDPKPPANSSRYMAVDLAISTRSTADNTAIVVGDVTESGCVYLKHVVKERLGSLKLVDTIVNVYNEWQPDLVFVEDQGFQELVIKDLRERDVPARPVKAWTNKVARASSLVILTEGHKFFLPNESDCPWVKDYVEELIAFPGGSRDDGVDSTAYLAVEAKNRTRGYVAPKVEVPKTPEQLIEEAKKAEEERYRRLLLWGLD